LSATKIERFKSIKEIEQHIDLDAVLSRRDKLLNARNDCFLLRQEFNSLQDLRKISNSSQSLERERQKVRLRQLTRERKFRRALNRFVRLLNYFELFVDDSLRSDEFDRAIATAASTARDATSDLAAQIKRTSNLQNELDILMNKQRALTVEMQRSSKKEARLLTSADEFREFLARSLAFVEDNTCPVCERDYGELTEEPLSIVLHRRLEKLGADAKKMESLASERQTYESQLKQLQDRSELVSRRLAELRSQIPRLTAGERAFSRLSETFERSTEAAAQWRELDNQRKELNTEKNQKIGARMSPYFVL
jgi:exonuclease SbcC